MTYSIVARDPQTGELGAAVQSHWFSVGSVTLAGSAGVGVVITQATPDIGFKPAGLELLAQGRTAQQTVHALIGSDPAAEHRQLAVVDPSGGVAVHTGVSCVAAAGHLIGDGWAVQANMMRSDAVWPAMADAFSSATGSLTERLLLALDAGEAAGGDLRGRQSAAILIVPASGGPADRIVDLRVEDHANPHTELRRLVRLHEAYSLADEADGLLAIGELEHAAGRYVAAHAIAPENDELRFWAALGLIGAGAEERGLALLRATIERDPVWLEMLPRVAHVAPASARASELLAAHR